MEQPPPTPPANDPAEEADAAATPPAEDATPTARESIELEPGWAASRALLRVSGDELLAVMLRPSFRPIKDLDLVPVARCPHCRDGGLRTAGSVRTRRGREPVRACDTCAAIQIGESVIIPRPTRPAED